MEIYGSSLRGLAVLLVVGASLPALNEGAGPVAAWRTGSGRWV
jgi:hypothetical protein